MMVSISSSDRTRKGSRYDVLIVNCLIAAAKTLSAVSPVLSETIKTVARGSPICSHSDTYLQQT